jgi:hypothetical protein
MTGNNARTQSAQRDYRRFGIALRDLLIECGITTRLGNPDWPGFSKKVPGLHYETLRKAVTRDREVAPKIIEAVAKALKVDAEFFAEYRLWQLRRSLDPAEVGVEAAFKNLARWEGESR